MSVKVENKTDMLKMNGHVQNGHSNAVSRQPNKPNPLKEFCVWYFGTILIMKILDYLGLIYPGRNSYNMVPYDIGYR